MTDTNKRARNLVLTTAAAVGIALGAAGLAGAATTGSSPSASADESSTYDHVRSDDTHDPEEMDHGPGEELLTGSVAEKVEAAALAEVPGATVIRVETDSAGAAYEAHLTDSDGESVTVRLNEDFEVVSTESGFGPCHHEDEDDSADSESSEDSTDA